MTIFDAWHAWHAWPTGRAPLQTAWRAIRGQLWLDHAVWKSGLTPKQFEREHIHRSRTASNLMAKWRSGETNPSRVSAIALERQIPGTLWLFDLPLFPLLADEPIAGPAYGRAVAAWAIKTQHGLGPDWRLPPARDGRTLYYSSDTSAFVHRGDIFGLAALVALMRRAEIEGNQYSHCEACKDAFRALPATMRLPWCSASARAIFDLLLGLQRRMPYSFLRFESNWDIIKALAERDDYEPDPLKRKGYSVSPYAVYPDPVVPMLQVPRKGTLLW